MSDLFTINNINIEEGENLFEPTCFKYRFDKLYHFHMAVVDCCDVYAAVLMQAAEAGGTWEIKQNIPVLREDIPALDLRAIDNPLDIVLQYFQRLKRDVRDGQLNLDITQLISCQDIPGKIAMSFKHVLFNQGQDLFNPRLHGWGDIKTIESETSCH
jgi:hypothetical protein